MRKRIYIDCMSTIPVATAGAGGAAAGTDNTVSHFTAGPYEMEIRYEQDCSDIIPVRVVDGNCCNGWQLPNDNTDNEGAEMGFGILADSNAQHCFKVGTDPAFEFEVKLGIPDVSDYDVCAIGFRTAAAYADAINTSAALLGAYSGATEHKFLINIELGDVHVQKTTNGADLEDDVAVTNWVDDGVHTLRVTVDEDGEVAAYYDGTAITLATANTAFDTDDILVPCIIYCKANNAADTPPIVNYIKCGHI